MSKPTKHYEKWRIRWVDEHGKRLSEVFPDFKTASYQLKKYESEVEEIKQGLRAPAPYNKTFNEICDYWIEKRLPQKRSQKDDLSIIKTHLRPNFGHLKIKELTVEKVDQFIAERTLLHKKTVSNHLTLLISLLRLAVDLNWLLKVPNIKKPKTYLFSREFSYLRNDEEIERFLTSARQEDEVAFLMYATAIYTGLRAGELAALKFSNIRFDGNKSIITVQESFDDMTKSGRVRYVPILAPLYPLLLEWKNRCGGEIVFPNRDGNIYSESGRIYQEVLHRVLKRAGFPEVIKNGKARRYIVFHDLRHTFASQWVMKSGDVFKLQKILGHANIAMTMRYAHLAPDAYSTDFERLGKNGINNLEGQVLLLSR